MPFPSPESMRLCWLDLEMTGLNANVDTILEIAALVSDVNNAVIFRGISEVIHYDTLPAMNTWVNTLHTQSGLLKAVAESRMNLEQVEDKVYQALKPYCNPETTHLAGNSIYQDRIFLKKYMPRLDSLFNYRMVDVSTFKVAVHMWYPESRFKDFAKSKEHRAFKDIEESMAELAHYRKYFFKKVDEA